MKEFLKKSWCLTRIGAMVLVYSLLGFPYVMWKVGKWVFDQEDISNAEFDNLPRSIREDLSKFTGL